MFWRMELMILEILKLQLNNLKDMGGLGYISLGVLFGLGLLTILWIFWELIESFLILNSSLKQRLGKTPNPHHLSCSEGLPIDFCKKLEESMKQELKEQM